MVCVAQGHLRDRSSNAMVPKTCISGRPRPAALTPKPVTDCCAWQVDDLPLSTSPPRRDPALSDSLWALTLRITEGTMVGDSC